MPRFINETSTTFVTVFPTRDTKIEKDVRKITEDVETLEAEIGSARRRVDQLLRWPF